MCMHAHRHHENYDVARLDDETRIDRRQAQFRYHATRYGWLVVICTAIWAVTGLGYFWPIWVMLFAGIRLALLARDAYGTTPEPHDEREDDLVEV
jgi:2TM domain